MTRHDLLSKINEVSFVVNDLTLYLDTHPTDAQALSLFDTNITERKRLLDEYESQFESLTIDCVRVNANHTIQQNNDEGNLKYDFCKYPEQNHFTWVDGPTPWEGGLI